MAATGPSGKVYLRLPCFKQVSLSYVFRTGNHRGSSVGAANNCQRIDELPELRKDHVLAVVWRFFHI